MKRLIILTLLLKFCSIIAIDQRYIPIAFYVPEKGFLVGSFYNIKQDNKYELTPEISEIRVFGVYFEDKTSNFKLMSQKQISDGEHGFYSELSFNRNDNDFYNLGINSENKSYEYNSEIIEAKFSFVKRFHKINLITGFSVKKVTYEDLTELNGIIDFYRKDFFSNYLSNSINLSLAYDNRDSSTFPTKGNSLMISKNFKLDQLDSDENMSHIKLDYRDYRSFNSTNVIATQFVFSNSSKSPRYESLNNLGDYLRSYSQNRYKNNDLFAIRSEYRTFPFSKKLVERLGFVFFAETGTVTDSISKIEKIKFDAGFGLRFVFRKETFQNLRLDFAFGEEGFNASVGFMEVF